MKRVRAYDIEDQIGGHRYRNTSSDLSKRSRGSCSKKWLVLVLVALVVLVVWYRRSGHNKGVDVSSDSTDGATFAYKIKPTVKHDQETIEAIKQRAKEGQKNLKLPDPELTCEFTTPNGDVTKTLKKGQSITVQSGPDCVTCTACSHDGMKCTSHHNEVCEDLAESNKQLRVVDEHSEEEEEEDEDYDEDED